MMEQILLVDPTGQRVEHVYVCERPFGRVQHDGVWYRSMHKRGRPDIYMRDETSEERAYREAVLAELERLDAEHPESGDSGPRGDG